ncbi:MAG TPA: hypothetical protein VFC93_14995 [Chloroflexota bacterium]|jgi:hypothetical protein|nr:hypothetical protein [Chloroflexota bacterium]
MDTMQRTAGPMPTDLGAFVLRRLERFALLGATAGGQARLARHAALSAYRDCVALGLRKEAETVLARAAQAARHLA